jgi:hypothetical protein
VTDPAATATATTAATASAAAGRSVVLMGRAALAAAIGEGTGLSPVLHV